jgi:KipI family sensor histidine kinase inhibitor
VLAEFEDLATVMSAATAWRAAGLPGVIDVVPAASTVLVVHDGSLNLALLPKPASASAEAVGELVVVPVKYDGDDLAEVAAACKMSIAEVIALHSGTEYTCAFCGFIAGFGYLVGLDERLVVPRRATPRTRVPRGSVAMASTFTGYKLQGDLGKFGKTEISDIEGYAELPDGKVLSCSEWGNMLLWDGGLIQTEICRRKNKACHSGPIHQITLDDGKLLNSVCKKG